jgi:SAM-dependent methyltransferase
MSEGTKESQYNICLDIAEKEGFARFGLMSNQVWKQDPKRLTFVLSRYKFVSKMLTGKDRVLEIGCADAFASRLVKDTVNQLTAVDFDPIFIKDAEDNADPAFPTTYKVHDILEAPVDGPFDAAYCVDVFEHIHPDVEDQFLKNVCAGLTDHGVYISGIPSLESQEYASQPSREGHVNCKSGLDFKAFLEKYFHNVFLFSMNDEVVHTGFHHMANYLFAVCAGKRNPSDA